MIMRQSVTAGKTPVGTEVQAKLVVGTLGDGTVFPKNAIFSRKVIESVARPRPNRDDGTVVIGSTRSDIKLDKLTNYVFAADELLRQNGFCSPTTARKTRLHNSRPGEFVDRRIYPVLQATDRP